MATLTTDTLNTKQEAKVVAFVAAAREAKSNGKLTGDVKADNATILRIANTHKQAAWMANGAKGTYCGWLCIPHFADTAIADAIGKQAVRKASGKAAPKVVAVTNNSGKGVFGRHPAGCPCVICTRIRDARAAKGEPVTKGETLTVEALATRVDSLDAKLDAILAKLTK